MSSRTQYRKGFTLVELLVVIGIIALLIGILMPSLSIARQTAQRTACAAKLHSIMIAAQIHLNDHRGRYPLVGVIPGWKPADLDDAYSAKYSYLADRNDSGYFTPYVAPITIALASEMSYRSLLAIDNNTDLGNAENDEHGFIRQFLCPSQVTTVSDFLQLPMLYSATGMGTNAAGATAQLSIIYWQQQSYNFNEAVLGWSDSVTSTRLRGNAAQIRQPAMTMFAADGLMGSIYDRRYPWTEGNGMATFYNIADDPPVTLADAFASDGLAGDVENFDIRRHRGRMNIAFCDGHVETRLISKNDLKSVYLLAP